jgi:hypothetical protein
MPAATAYLFPSVRFESVHVYVLRSTIKPVIVSDLPMIGHRASRKLPRTCPRAMLIYHFRIVHRAHSIYAALCCFVHDPQTMPQELLAIPSGDAHQKVTSDVSSAPLIPLPGCLNQISQRCAQIVAVRPRRKVLLKPAHVADPPDVVAGPRAVAKTIGDLVAAKFRNQVDSLDN